MSHLLNFAMFYVGWFACVAGAGRGQLWLGPVVVAVILVGHIFLARDRAREARCHVVAWDPAGWRRVDRLTSVKGSPVVGEKIILPAAECPARLMISWARYVEQDDLESASSHVS